MRLFNTGVRGIFKSAITHSIAVVVSHVLVRYFPTLHEPAAREEARLDHVGIIKLNSALMQMFASVELANSILSIAFVLVITE